MSRIRFRAFAVSLAAAAVASFIRAEPLIRKGDRLAIIGDSITEQKLYSKYMETYLRVCTPQLEVKVIQLGWSGERADGFAARMQNDLLPWKPTLATTCYGMNDGSYRPYSPEIGTAYSNNMLRIVTQLKQAGGRVVIGSPGVVDSATWKPAEPDADQYYNASLATLGRIGQAIAASEGAAFADVHGVMRAVMDTAKADLGPTYHVAGGDGVHPAPNGHLCMAYAFLTAMQLDGRIARLNVGWPATVEASEGHTARLVEEGVLAVDSTRYPFCFSGEPGSPAGTASVLPYLDFNGRLNRFELAVADFPAPQAEIIWDEGTAIVTRDQLAQGVNLAAIIPANPFREPFEKVMAAVAAKQQRETQLIKGFLTALRHADSIARDAEAQAALEVLRNRVMAELEKSQAGVQALVVPVSHTITIRPVTAKAEG